MAVFLERMRRRREDLALISLLVFGLEEMVQSPWAIPGISSHFFPCMWTCGDGIEPMGHPRYEPHGSLVWQAAVVGSQAGNCKSL